MARILKWDAQKYLARVPDEHIFYLHSGGVIRDMHELGEALRNMSDETFAYHSDEGKKDFSKWAKDIIGDEKLSRDLSKATSRTRAVKFVTDREKFLRSKLT
ncbi:MAG: hypothetical protein ABIB93_02210 [Chloroflexota bacterium]